MELLGQEDLKDTTRDSVYYYLLPWARWLDRRNCRPTDQLLKEHLIERKLAKLSYIKIGNWCVKFCNWYVPGHEKLELIAPVGLARERATLEMPRAMVDELGEYLMA